MKDVWTTAFNVLLAFFAASTVIDTKMSDLAVPLGFIIFVLLQISDSLIALREKK